MPRTAKGQKGKYYNESAVIIWYEQEHRISLNIVERDLLTGNRVQLDTIRGDLPGRSTYVCIGQWYPTLSNQDLGRHRLRPVHGRQPIRGTFRATTSETASRSIDAGNPQARERFYNNDSCEVVRAAPQSLQEQPGQNLQALILSLEQIELRLQRK